MGEITGKTIWVVGASSGIGSALAEQLVDAGNFVIVSARSQDKLEQLVSYQPKKMAYIPMDVTTTDNNAIVIDQLQNITDTIDIVIMAAGTVAYEDNLEFDVEMYRQVFDVNVIGMVNTLAIAKPFLERTQQRAYIVGVTSLSMMIGFPRAEAYGASKAAADYFLHSLFVDLPKRKYDVSVVRPGFVKTPMTSENDFPMPFLMSADDAAKRIINGMKKRKRLIVFPKRLQIILQLLAYFPCLWYNYLGPKASREQHG